MGLRVQGFAFRVQGSGFRDGARIRGCRNDERCPPRLETLLVDFTPASTLDTRVNFSGGGARPAQPEGSTKVEPVAC